jgi:flagellar biosynthesis chaperone FliJ
LSSRRTRLPVHGSNEATSDDAHQRELEFLREMLEQERSTHARTRADHDRERHSWNEERTFLRGMLEKQTEQVRLLTDQRERKWAHSPSLLARLFLKNA